MESVGESQNTATAAPIKNPSVERITAAAGEVFNRHDPGAGSLSAQALPGAGPAPLNGAVVDPAVSMVSREMVEKSVKAVVRTVDSHLCGKFHKLALRIEPNEPQLAANLVAETRATDEEIEQLGILAGIVAEKHSVVAQYAPEAALLFCIGGLGFRYWAAVNQLKQILAEKTAAEKLKQKAAA